MRRNIISASSVCCAAFFHTLDPAVLYHWNKVLYHSLHPPQPGRVRDHAQLGKKVLLLRGGHDLSEYVCKLLVSRHV